MPAALAIALKDLRLLFRDRGDAFFTFVFPVLFALFFGLIFRGGAGAGNGAEVAGVSVVISDLDGTPASRALVESLRADPAFRVLPAPASPLLPEQLVRDGRASAVVVIPAGFGEQSRELLQGQGLTLELITDPSRGAEAGLVQGKLTQHAFQSIVRSFTDPTTLGQTLATTRERLAGSAQLPPQQRATLTFLLGALEQASASGALGTQPAPAEGTAAAPDPLAGFSPVRITTRSFTSLGAEAQARPTSSWDVSMPQGLVWGLMGCVVAFAASIAQERSLGTLRRLATSPIGARTVLLGKALACAICCVLVQLLLLAVFVPLGVRVPQPLVLALALFFNSVGFAGIMMAMAGLATTQAGASGMARGIALVLAMIGGGTIPLFIMPGWMQTVSSISPFKWAVLATEGALWRGMPMGQLAVPLAVLAGFGLVGFAIGAVALRRAHA